MGVGLIEDVDPDVQSSLEALLENDPEFSDDGTEERKPAKPAKAVGSRGGNQRRDDDSEPEGYDGEEEGEEEGEAQRAKAAEEEGEEKAEDDEEEGEGGIETLSQLAEAFGVDEKELRGALRVDLGEERGEATLGELIERASAEPDTSRVDEAVSAYEQQASQLHEQWSEQTRQLAARANALMNLIEADDSRISQARERGDSEEVLRLLDDQQRRREALNGAIGHMQQSERQWKAQQAEDERKYRERETQLLQRKMPALRDPAKSQAAMAAIEKSLTGVGFTQDEVESLTDHRAILVAHKAAEYDRLAAKIRAGKKKAALKLPRVLKRSARDDKAPQRATAKRSKDKMTRLRSSGSEADAAAVLLDRID